MLPVGLSSVSLAHNLEVESESHLVHQCEIYDAIQVAILTSDCALPVVHANHSYYDSVLTEASLNPYELPRTRSPPLA